jgi:hypothetical protein
LEIIVLVFVLITEHYQFPNLIKILYIFVFKTTHICIHFKISSNKGRIFFYQCKSIKLIPFSNSLSIIPHCCFSECSIFKFFQFQILYKFLDIIAFIIVSIWRLLLFQILFSDWEKNLLWNVLIYNQFQFQILFIFSFFLLFRMFSSFINWSPCFNLICWRQIIQQMLWFEKCSYSSSSSFGTDCLKDCTLYF